MESPTSNSQPQAARAAVLSLQSAVAMLRERPDAEEVHAAAERRAVAAVVEATSQGDLLLTLRAGAVHWGEQIVLEFQPEDRPFGRLRASGIGEIRFAQSLAPERVVQFVRRLATVAVSTHFDEELNALLDAAQIQGIELRSCVDADAPASRLCDWQELPQPLANSPELRGVIARDAACNLPALAVHQLLVDAEQAASRAPAPPPGHAESIEPERRVRFDAQRTLQRLLQRLLAARDFSTATWVLTEVERSAHFEPQVVHELRDLANGHCDEAWQRAMLANCTTDEMLQLSALMMQLGSDVAVSFARCAAELAHPLSQWLSELMGNQDSRALKT